MTTEKVNMTFLGRKTIFLGDTGAEPGKLAVQANIALGKNVFWSFKKM